MAPSTATYRVDVWKLEQLLADLQNEYAKAKLTLGQRTLFVLLQIAVYSIPAVLLVWWLILDPAFGGSAGEVLFFIVGCGLILMALVFLAVLLPLNLSLVRMIVRQIRLDRRLRRLVPEERGVPPPPERSERSDFWLKGLAGTLLVLTAVSVVLAGIQEDFDWLRLTAALVVLGVPGFLIWSGRTIPFRLVRIAFWLLVATLAAVVGLFVLAALGIFGVVEDWEDFWMEMTIVGIPFLLVLLLPALVLASNRYLSWLRRRMRLLDDVDRLRGSLERQRAEAFETGELVVDLTRAQAERLSEVESAYIRQQRAAAIGEARGGGATSYTTFKTQACRSQLESLEPRARLLAESAIEELSIDPHPEGATLRTGSGGYRLAIPGAGVEILYEVDDSRRHLQIRSVLPPGEDGRSEGGSPTRPADG